MLLTSILAPAPAAGEESLFPQRALAPAEETGGPPEAGASAPPAGASATAAPPSKTPYNLTGRGLLGLQDPFPFAVLHLQFPIDTLEVLAKGEGKIDLNVHWANSFALGDKLVVDAETYRLELGGWYALRDDFYIGASLPFLARDSGVLDSLVDEFHRSFGYEKGDRAKRPDDAYALRVVTEDGVVHELDSGAGLGDLVLKSHWNVNPGDAWLPAFSIQGLAGLPTSMPGFGTDGLDLGLTVSMSKTVLDYFHLHGNVGILFLIDPKVRGIPYEKVIYQGSGGLEVAIIDDFSFIFQAMSYGPLLESPAPLDQARNYIAWGLKWEYLPGLELQVSVVENIFPFRNTADIAFATAFSFRM